MGDTDRGWIGAVNDWVRVSSTRQESGSQQYILRIVLATQVTKGSFPRSVALEANK